MKKFFVGIYNWVMKVAVEYQQQKEGIKKYRYRKCSYCGKRHLFDVSDISKDVKVSEIVFICNSKECEESHLKSIITDESQELREFKNPPHPLYKCESEDDCKAPNCYCKPKEDGEKGSK